MGTLHWIVQDRALALEEAAARALLDAALARVAPGDVLLATGETTAERVACEGARARGARTVEFRVDGYRWHDGALSGRRWYDPSTLTRAQAADWHGHRARAMSEAVATAAARGFAAALLLVRGARLSAEQTVALEARARVAMALRELSVPDAAAAPRGELDVVWCDLETTGVKAGRAHAIEIGAVRCSHDSRTELDTFEARIALDPAWPGVADALRRGPALSRDGFLVREALRIGQYRAEDWKDAEASAVVLARFAAWLPRAFLFANHRASFDVNILTEDFRMHGLPLPGWRGRPLDTLPHARRVLKKTGKVASCKLGDLCSFFGVTNDGAHTALADARRARDVYLKLVALSAGFGERELFS